MLSIRLFQELLPFVIGNVLVNENIADQFHILNVNQAGPNRVSDCGVLIVSVFLQFL